MAGATKFVDDKLKQRRVILFTKSYSPECKLVRGLLDEYKLSDTEFEVVEIERRQDVVQIENYFQILCLTDSRAVSVFLLCFGRPFDNSAFLNIWLD